MNLVNVSEGASLAMHSLAIVAAQHERRLTVKEIAEELKASQAHLAKVFQKLSRAGLVTSTRGPAGGIELKKSAEEITFLDIYETIEGPVITGGCPLSRNYCAFDSCIFSNELERVADDMYGIFKKIKLSDFYN